MTVFPLVEPETATGVTEGLLAKAHRVLGLTPNVVKAIANSPAALRGYLELSRALRDSSLPPATRSRVALLAAERNGCDYCLSMHTYTGTRTDGLTPEAAALARAGAAEDPKDAAALAFADALIRSRGAVADAELAAAAAELSSGELVEVIAHVALNIFGAYVALAGRLEIDWPLVEHGGARPLGRSSVQVADQAAQVEEMSQGEQDGDDQDGQKYLAHEGAPQT
ncbi:carboxymuconolactone decarboxylase family protein [Nonomuraea sp. NPDC050556]|uniref:carboxymuconolactone decarboxylase family protein n=1 Tax=Nonomuraea sp. NPDC050556 TaxID=3364369 RepID=UPI003791168D